MLQWSLDGWIEDFILCEQDEQVLQNSTHTTNNNNSLNQPYTACIFLFVGLRPRMKPAKKAEEALKLCTVLCLRNKYLKNAQKN